MGWSELATSVWLASSPVDDTSSHKARLLSELTIATEDECVGHDELIARYEQAQEASSSFELQLGLVRAKLLRRTQTGRREDDASISAALDVLMRDPLASRYAEQLVELRATLAMEPERPCAPVEPEPPEPDPEPPEPEPESPEPDPRPQPATEPMPRRNSIEPTPPIPSPVARWTRPEQWTVGTGSAVGAAGLAALTVGITGPFLARARIDGEPTQAQQRYLDDTVPRQAAGWTGLGAALTAVGTGLVVYGLVHRRCRRRAC